MINENSLLTSQRLQSNLRYTLCTNMMNEYFIQFLNNQNSISLIENLIKECKKNTINLVRKFFFTVFRIHLCLFSWPIKLNNQN